MGNKVLRCQMELNQVKTEIERRIAEKDEEFAMVRKNQAKALDSMQSALETEAKGKAEALRMKKKLEADSGDLGLALEHAIAGSAETQNTIKKYQLQVRDAQVKVDAKVSADRKAAAMQNCLEESRALLETADRQRRAAEQELADTNENLADLSNVNQSIAAARRKLESEYNQLSSDLDEMTNEARLSEEKAARAMVDAESRRNTDVLKNLRKAERSIKELTFAGDEDKKNHERMQGLIDQLQGKVKSYKKQIEEAEEIAALNLAKYRQVQSNLTGSSERADISEQALAMSRARARSCSIGPL